MAQQRKHRSEDKEQREPERRGEEEIEEEIRSVL